MTIFRGVESSRRLQAGPSPAMGDWRSEGLGLGGEGRQGVSELPGNGGCGARQFDSRPGKGRESKSGGERGQMATM